jgi:hypothetical protein
MPVASAVLGEKLAGLDEVFKNVFVHNVEDLRRLHCNNLTQSVKEICIGKLVSCAHEFLEEVW